MAKSKLKGQAFWSIVLQFSRFGGNAVIFLAMARFLTIEQIGAFGMAYAPIRWMQVLHKTGISDSVVVTMRRKNAGEITKDDPAFTALFWLAMVVTVLISLVILGIALALATFQDADQPVYQMMLVMLIVPLAFGLSSVPEGLMRKNFQIKALALRTLAVQLLSAVFTVVLAIQGFGGWSLVGFAVLNAVMTSIISIAMAGWRPSGGPDWRTMRAILPQTSAVSGRVLVAGLVYAMLQFSVGLVLGLGAAGAFQIAQRVYQILDALCLAPVRFLVLPMFSRTAEQGDGTLPGSQVLRALSISGLIAAPIYLGTIVVAEPLLTLAIGPENTSHSLSTLQLLCTLGFSICSVTILSQALTVAGRADIAFWRTLQTLTATAMIALPALLISVEAVTLGFVVASYLVLAFFYRQIAQIFAVSKREVFLAVARPYLAGLLAFAPLWWFQAYSSDELGWSNLSIVLVIIFAGIPAYLVGARLLAPVAFSQMKEALKR